LHSVICLNKAREKKRVQRCLLQLLNPMRCARYTRGNIFRAGSSRSERNYVLFFFFLRLGIAWNIFRTQLIRVNHHVCLSLFLESDDVTRTSAQRYHPSSTSSFTRPDVPRIRGTSGRTVSHHILPHDELTRCRRKPHKHESLVLTRYGQFNC
jgi:hypothetical protein